MIRTLDRLPEFDERSRDHAIRAMLGVVERRPKLWRLLERLDQGREGACVGFGWAHEKAALPLKIKQTDEDARTIYHRARQLDQWPGEDYEGTSVLAGAKAVAEQGHMPEYRWAFGVDDVLDALSAHGPVVIGVNWYDGMWDTDAKGFLVPSGKIVGGHCVCLRGVGHDRVGWFAIGRNSWGMSWGVRGDFKIREHALDSLLRDEGDACVPVLRR